MEIILFLLLVAYSIAAIPLSIIIGGRVGVYFAIFSALIEFLFEGAVFVGGGAGTLTNTLLCDACGSTSVYPWILLPVVITIFQFGITFTKKYPSKGPNA